MATKQFLSSVSTVSSVTERMFARSPVEGYALWLDLSDLSYIYLAEAPRADAATTATFRGIRVAKDAGGSPTGKVEVATNFAWASRATATWQ